MTGIFWSACISFHIFRALSTENENDSLFYHFKYYVVISYGIPLLLAVIPFFFQPNYDFTGAW